MSFVNKEQIREARQMDLLSYLRANDPSELVHISGQNYCTREHDSLKISNGKWYWFSRGFGGVSALDYLIKVKDIPLPQSVEAILGRVELSPPVSYTEKKPEPKRLLLPERNSNAEQVIRYLRGRGIHPAVIQYCLDHKLLYESRDYHNAVFVGYDERGHPAYIDGKERFSFIKDKISKQEENFIATRNDSRRREVKTIEELMEGNLYYIVCIDTPEKLSPLYEKYRNQYHCVYQKDIYSHDQWLEIMPLNVSKANAIKQLKTLLGCEKVIAFGDGVNDIEMFQLADECYAVSNAAPELKKVATGIIGTNDEDAVAKWMIKRLHSQ